MTAARALRTIEGVDLLGTYVAAWRESCERVLALCARLQPDDWQRPTDLPGWSVHDVLAHLADVETRLAGADPAAVHDSPADGSGREVPPEWTQRGVDARRGTPDHALVRELADAVQRRAHRLASGPRPEPTDRPAATPAGLDWDWQTLLRNRAIDVWVHEQDIRRAVAAPGGITPSAAAVTVRSFGAALPYVLGKRVAPPAGTVVAWDVHGPAPLELVLTVDEDGRARPLDAPPSGATRLRMDTETFALLGAGRRAVDAVALDIVGDPTLGRRVAAAMAVTP